MVRPLEKDIKVFEISRNVPSNALFIKRIKTIYNMENIYYDAENQKIYGGIYGSINELKEFRDKVNSGNTFEDKVVLLTNNINLDNTENWECIGYYPMESTSPDNELNKPFKGIFDGWNYEINGLYINTTDKVKGLFGLVYNGTIKNVGIGNNCSLSGNVSFGAVACAFIRFAQL